jgi:hypothetical protein
MIKPEIAPKNKTLSPKEYEEKLLEIENRPEKNNPLDVHAAMIKYYIPKIKNNLIAMSKKQIITMALNLSGNQEFNNSNDVKKLIVMTKDLGLKAVQRVFCGVIINPFDEVELNLTVDKEKRLFVLFDSLLTNKYLNCLAKGLSEASENKKQELEEFILHEIKASDTLFKKLTKIEKDSFFIANKMLCSKYLIFLVKTSEFREKEANGK